MSILMPSDSFFVRALMTLSYTSGKDGSRQVTAQVDATGTGKGFVAATVVTNGDAVRIFLCVIRRGYQA